MMHFNFRFVEQQTCSEHSFSAVRLRTEVRWRQNDSQQETTKCARDVDITPQPEQLSLWRDGDE